MGLKCNCPKCNNVIVFPDTPNAETDKYEMFAHNLYTMFINNKRLCGECEGIMK